MSSTIPQPPATEKTPAHRKFVGPPDRYDLNSAMQFNLLVALGLREDHALLDIGCGSLRGGRLFITYLKPDRYFGIEPEQWLIDEGIDGEIGRDLIKLKNPKFSNDANFSLTLFNRKFDFLVAQSIFSHASAAQIRRCLSEVKKVLEPAGIFAATVFPGDTNYDGADWVYPGRVTYTPEFFAEMVSAEGLSCKALNWTHTKGQKWFAITHPDFTSPDVMDTGRTTVLEHEVAALGRELEKIKKLHGLKLLKKINRVFRGKPKS